MTLFLWKLLSYGEIGEKRGDVLGNLVNTIGYLIYHHYESNQLQQQE